METGLLLPASLRIIPVDMEKGSDLFYHLSFWSNHGKCHFFIKPVSFAGLSNLKPGLNGVARVIAATRNSFRGTRDAWLHESAFRQDVVLFFIFFLLSFGLARTVVEWIILIFPLFLLLIVEILNSAIENTVDRIGGERHILSGRAKDMGSAAVMFCLVFALIVWSVMIWSRYFA